MKCQLQPDPSARFFRIIRVIVRPDIFLALAAETTPPPRAPVPHPPARHSGRCVSRGSFLARASPCSLRDVPLERGGSRRNVVLAISVERVSAFKKRFRFFAFTDVF